jgi:hypothetical protein
MSKKNPVRKVKAIKKNALENILDGGIRELKAATILMREGLNVSFPTIDNRYDLIAEKYPKFYRVQVKSLNLQYSKNIKYTTSVDQYVIHAYSTPQRHKKIYTKQDCDYIMGICMDKDIFAFIPIEKVPTSGIIRVSEKTNVSKYINKICI